MTDLYSYKGAYPYSLPQDLAGYDINDFVLAPPKPTTIAGQQVEWNGSEWEVRNPTDVELSLKWDEVRNTRNKLLQDADTKILRYLELGNAVPENIVVYRQSLRDLPQLQSDPFNIVWPSE